MHPYFLRLGPYVIRSYVVLLFLAFFLGSLLLRRRAKRSGPPFSERIAWDVPIWIFLGAMTVSRYYWLVEYASDWSVWEGLAFWRAGHVYYGGLLGGMLAVLFYAKVKHLSVLSMLDILSPSLAFGYGLTRVGCFLNGCCYGKLTDMPWGVCYPPSLEGVFRQQVEEGILTVAASASLPVHPAPLYAAAASLAFWPILEWVWKLRIAPGTLTYLYFIFYGLSRFILEFFRADSPVYEPMGWKFAQYISLALVLFSASVLCLNGYRWRKR